MELLAPNGMPAFKSEEDIAPIQKLIREKAELVIRNFCRSTNDKFSEPNKLDVFEVENEDANVTAQENQIDGTLVADNFRFYESKKPNIECVYQRDDL
jgi:hypothetical protein